MNIQRTETARYLGPCVTPNTAVVDKSYNHVETWSKPIQPPPGNVLELLVYANTDTEDEKIHLSHHEYPYLPRRRLETSFKTQRR